MNVTKYYSEGFIFVSLTGVILNFAFTNIFYEWSVRIGIGSLDFQIISRWFNDKIICTDQFYYIWTECEKIQYFTNKNR